MTTVTALHRAIGHTVGSRAGHRAGAAAWLVLGLVAGCTWMSGQPAAVAVQGHSRDIRRLAGTWRGEFHSQTGPGLYRHDPAAEISSVVMPVVLRFGSLATSDGSIGGSLQPYRDPDLSCWMDTWFEGD